MLPKNVSEAEVSDLFSKFGTIKDLQILRGSQQTSKGMMTLLSFSSPFFAILFLLQLLSFVDVN